VSVFVAAPASDSVSMSDTLSRHTGFGGFGCVATTCASGIALSLATAGQYSSFTITSRDAYNNPRDFAESFSVLLIGSEEAPLYGGLSAPLNTRFGKSVASYIAFEAQPYHLYVNQGGGDIKGSPFALTVVANRVCGTTSTLSCDAITSASLSPAVNTFRIQVRDAFSNERAGAEDTGTQLSTQFTCFTSTKVQILTQRCWR
jgi:hypothetical protein